MGTSLINRPSSEGTHSWDSRTTLSHSIVQLPLTLTHSQVMMAVTSHAHAYLTTIRDDVPPRLVSSRCSRATPVASPSAASEFGLATDRAVSQTVLWGGKVRHLPRRRSFHSPSPIFANRWRPGAAAAGVGNSPSASSIDNVARFVRASHCERAHALSRPVRWLLSSPTSRRNARQRPTRSLGNKMDRSLSLQSTVRTVDSPGRLSLMMFTNPFLTESSQVSLY